MQLLYLDLNQYNARYNISTSQYHREIIIVNCNLWVTVRHLGILGGLLHGKFPNHRLSVCISECIQHDGYKDLWFVVAGGQYNRLQMY